MNKWAKLGKKTLITSAIFTLGYLGVFYGSKQAGVFLSHHRDPDVELYIKENLDRIIQDQEEKLKITYPSLPKIEYVLSSSTANGSAMGEYLAFSNHINLASSLLTLPEMDFSDWFAKIITLNGTEKAEDVVNHELGHFYCDQLSETLGYGSWPNYFFKNEFQQFSLKLISEGIATYFEMTMNNTPDNFKDEEWPENIALLAASPDSMANYWFYYGGYHLVKPVIDKYKSEGIAYLMFYPPTQSELRNLSQYQKKVMEKLSVKEKADELLFPNP